MEWEAIDEAKKEFAKANKFTLTKEEEDASEEMSGRSARFSWPVCTLACSIEVLGEIKKPPKRRLVLFSYYLLAN